MGSSAMLRALDRLHLLLTANGPLRPRPGGTDHAPLGHTPLWAHENPNMARPYAEPDARPLFEVLDEDTPAPVLLEKTALVIFLGAQHTPLFQRCLERDDVVCAVFDTDPHRVAELARSVGPERLAEVPVPLFCGNVQDFTPPLSAILPREMFQAGFPVFMALDGQDEAFLDWAREVAEELEVLFYRYRIYPLTGQFNARGHPIRPMKRELFYDQLYHGYANCHAACTASNLSQARNALEGETAVVVAAGPALHDQLDWLRQHRDRAVIIAVNNAMAPLLKAGIEPHICVLNDNSLAVDDALEQLEPSSTMLAAHCLSGLGAGRFEKTFLFGIWMPGVFGLRPELELYGSVVTAGFSLARHLGCQRCVFCGVQLADTRPVGLGYAKDTVHEHRRRPGSAPDNRWPRLYPARSASGDSLYTSLNFLDTAHWFRDHIRQSDVECVNLTRNSLLHGRGIAHDPAPSITPTGGLGEKIDALRNTPAEGSAPESVLRFVQDETERWNKTSALCSRLLQADDTELLRAGAAVLDQFDQNNVSYLVQRFDDFENARFHADWFGSSSSNRRAAALRYYFDHVRRMAGTLAALLRSQRRKLRQT